MRSAPRSMDMQGEGRRCISHCSKGSLWWAEQGGLQLVQGAREQKKGWGAGPVGEGWVCSSLGSTCKAWGQQGGTKPLP